MLAIPMIKTLYTCMWQAHVKNELSYLTTISNCNSAVESPRSSNLHVGFSNLNLSARGEPTSGFNCESLILGELIELS